MRRDVVHANDARVLARRCPGASSGCRRDGACAMRPRSPAGASHRAERSRSPRIATLRTGRSLRVPTSTRAPPAACAARATARCPASATRPPMDVRRRSARRRGRRAGRAVRRPGGAAARQHAGGAGHARASSNVYIANVVKCRPPGNRTPEPRRSRRVPSLSRAADRADRAEADRRAGQERRVAAARQRRDDREPARPRAPLPRRPADRDVPSGLPAAQPARQGEGVGGPVLGTCDRRKSPRCMTPARSHSKLASASIAAIFRARGPRVPALFEEDTCCASLPSLIAAVRRRSRSPAAATTTCSGRTSDQGRLVGGGEPVPAPRRPRAQPRQHGQGLRRAGRGRADSA